MRRRRSTPSGNSNPVKKSRSKIHRSADTSTPILTWGKIFPDGATIDLVRDAANRAVKLHFSDGQRTTIAPQLEFGGQLYIPAPLGQIHRNVTLPHKSVHFESTEKLFAGAQQLFVSNNFSSEVSLTATHFAFAAWFPEVLPVAPCLLITGAQLEAALLLELLACVVRCPIMISEFARRSLNYLPLQLLPTLLINTQQMSGPSLELLRASNRHHAFFSLNRTLIDVFCAKALYCGQLADSNVIDENAIHIGLPPYSGRIPIIDQESREEITREFQSKFLAYRCRHINEVRHSEFDFPESTPATRILARTLGAPIVGAPILQTGLIRLLREHEEDGRDRRWTDLRCVAVEALLHHCHKEPGTSVHVGKVTETLNGILEGRGETAEHTAEKVGKLFKSLGFSRGRDSGGKTLLLDRVLSRDIHLIARGMGVPAIQKGWQQCPECQKIGEATKERSDMQGQEKA